MILDLPDHFFSNYQWSLLRPTQMNRSEWTGRRQVMGLPGGSRWSVQMTRSPILGTQALEPWRAFIASLKGQVGVFRVPAVGGAQRSGVNPRVRAPAAFPLVNAFGVFIDGGNTQKVNNSAAWDSAAYSSVTGGAGFSISVTAAGAIHNVMAGLNRTPGDGVSYERLEIAAWLDANSMKINVLRDGADFGQYLAPFAPGDVVSSAYSGRHYSVFLNGRAIYAGSAPEGRTHGFDSSYFSFSGRLDATTGGTLASGVTSLNLTGLPVSAQALPAGAMMTIPTADGSEQLVVLTAPLISDSTGNATAVFEPPLRYAAVVGAPVETVRPWCVMSLDDPSMGWSTERQALHSLSISATEAY